MSNSQHQKADLFDMRVYSLEEPEVFALATENWCSEAVSRWRSCGSYYSVNFDYFVEIDIPNLGGHVLAPWWRKP